MTETVAKVLPVVDVALNVFRRGRHAVSFDELRSIGNEQVMAVVLRFPEADESDLRRFAYVRVRGAMLDSLRPCGPERRQRTVARVRDSLAGELGRPATIGEIANETKLSRRTVAVTLSELDVAEGSSIPKLEWIPDDSPSADELVASTETNEVLIEAVATLPHEEAVVIRRVIFEGALHEEVGAELNLSAGRICQLRLSGLRRLRRNAKVSELIASR